MNYTIINSLLDNDRPPLPRHSNRLQGFFHEYITHDFRYLTTMLMRIILSVSISLVDVDISIRSFSF
jgi:hypothetical protein